ncbi:MAG TPA: hypothetical protein VNY05_20970 [Candidatus Acidoferrales bacterium]|nr:hypothetical protein [Candidatus Acidoferrales bacterium]
MIQEFRGSTQRIGRGWRPILCISLGFCLAALLLSCQRPSESAPQPAAAIDPFAEPVPHSRDADDAGRFLAGMPGTVGSPFRELEDRPAWKLHRRQLDIAWAGIEEQTIPRMREFQKAELGDAPLEKSVVLYPFSGPDALVLTVFFPQNPTYVMVALEPPGTLPTPKQLSRQDLVRKLAGVRDTVYSELHRSFFITRQMDRQFRGQVSDGLLPPILHLLVRTGHTILGHRFVRLDENGLVAGRAEGAPSETGNRGVELEFRTDADQSVHKLFYYSTNLSDQRLSQNHPFLTFLSKLNRVTAFFKATSYMTHKPEFSLIRDQVLAHGGVVLEDDSGIPYHFFREQSWKVQLYGAYVRPYGSFKWMQQPDLKQAYTSSEARPLQFRIGYGFGKIASNLILARKE